MPCGRLRGCQGVCVEGEGGRGQEPLPQEWYDLDYEWNLTLDKIIAGKFIECGEPGMAALFASDHCDFYRRHENGKAFQFRYNGDESNGEGRQHVDAIGLV